MATPAPLPKSPDLLNDTDLTAWVQRIVDDQVPESLVIDYKRRPYDLTSAAAKLELAKDISSFANSQGGALLLGIPQVKAANGLALPGKAYGVARTPDYEERVRNVLAGALSPLLPHARVLWIPKAGDQSKGVYLMWHPESWLAPHMVHGYSEFRYFRRDADVSRPVPMSERDIERLYELRATGEQRSLALIGGMEDTLGPRHGGPQMRVCICPRLLLDDSVDFSSARLQERLLQNPFGTAEARPPWLPTSTGAHCAVLKDGIPYLVAHLLTNGALLVGQHLTTHTIGNSVAPSFDHLKAVLWEAYRYIGGLYGFLGREFVELRVRVALWYIDGMPLCTAPDEHQALGRFAKSGQPAILDNGLLASELIVDAETAMKPVLDWVWRTFGIDWTVPAGMARVPERWKR